ncbi:hypothetical protein TrLO_g3300 [Triparma laevis f. longispina]|uniref:Uncharacterized protein n=1 Tax=Triparma laevis f. longispina TaxID=1714387 RepID=A0A9W7KZN3_9STRA|nr:hypothetical protein TrLO_g3300 [Triparma laevis f. longispina]
MAKLWSKLSTKFGCSKETSVAALSKVSHLSGEEQLEAASKILSSPPVARYTELIAILSGAGPPPVTPTPRLPPPPATPAPFPQDGTRCNRCGATGKHGSSQKYPTSFHCPTCIEEIDNPECEGCGEKFGVGVCESACCHCSLYPGCIDEIAPKCGSCQERKCCSGEDGDEAMEESPSLGKVCSDCIVDTNGEKCGSCEQRHMECEEDDWSVCVGCYRNDVDGFKCSGCSEMFDMENGEVGHCARGGQYGSVVCANCLCSEEDRCQHCEARQPRKRQRVEVE